MAYHPLFWALSDGFRKRKAGKREAQGEQTSGLAVCFVIAEKKGG